MSESLEERIAECLPRAYRLASTLALCRADAEDAVGNAVAALLARPGRYDPARSFYPYFARCVVNAVNRARATEARRTEREREMARDADTGAAEEPWLRGEAERAVRAALEALAPAERAAVLLVCADGLSQADAGEVLGVPQTTVSDRVRRGLDNMRRALIRAGFAGAMTLPLENVLGSLPCAPAPAGLAAKVGSLVSGQAQTATAGAGGAGSVGSGATAVATGGGLAMKVILGVVVAGAMAAGVATVDLAGRRSEPRDTGAAPPAAPAADVKPAPVNPYAGMQQREEVFEFTQKPAVKKEGAGWVITFASKANCDATVAVLDKDGKTVRHLASGVLGKNAPWPLQQNSLSQKLEWDGKDDQDRPVAAEALKGCTVRVSLGLQAKFERNIGWDPANFPGWGKGPKAPQNYMIAKGEGGDICVVGCSNDTGGTIQGRVFKDGKYVKTLWPPSAKDLEKIAQLGYKVGETIWGDKIWINEDAQGSRYGTATIRPARSRQAKTLEDATKELLEFVGMKEVQAGPWPAEVPASTGDPFFNLFHNGKYQRMAADRTLDELYLDARVGTNERLQRIDTKTGELDPTWFPKGEMSKVAEVCVGPDSTVHISTGSLGYGQFVTRLTREGKPVDFGGDAVPLPKKGRWEGGGGQYGEEEGKPIYGGNVCPDALKKVGDIKSLWTGVYHHSSVQELQLYVTPKGYIVHGVAHPAAHFFSYWDAKGVPSGIAPEARDKVSSATVVWDPNGKLLTTAAVGDTQYSHGVVMDREGNIYNSYFQLVPAEQKGLFGLKGDAGTARWGGIGSLVKFRGGAYPLGGVVATPGASSLAVQGRKGVGGIDNAQWAYGSMTVHQSMGCTCHNVRYDMDWFARPWVMAHHLYSILVLDSNGNLIARLGKYGNVDDTEEDVKAGRDGLRFIWPRSLCVSDKSLYVGDHNARRVLKAALSYAAEESVPVP